MRGDRDTDGSAAIWEKVPCRPTCVIQGALPRRNTRHAVPVCRREVPPTPLKASSASLPPGVEMAYDGIAVPIAGGVTNEVRRNSAGDHVAGRRRRHGPC